jgi:hypothetical protein
VTEAERKGMVDTETLRPEMPNGSQKGMSPSAEPAEITDVPFI